MLSARRGLDSPVSLLPADRTPVVLIVDDAPQNLQLLGAVLRGRARVLAARSGPEALRIARGSLQPDLILLDIMMPEMDGHEVLRRLRADPATSGIPVIFITAMAAEEDEERGLELGAVDYISKPFVPAIVQARVQTHLELKLARDRLAHQNDWLEHEIARRMRENELVRDLSLHALAVLAEVRDLETGLHLTRTRSYVEILARHLRDHPRFEAALSSGRLLRIVKAAPLHDVGKVGVPDAIIRKPGRLTAEEFEVMKTHTTIGARAIETALRTTLEAIDASDRAGSEGALAFMRAGAEIALSHHERFDGSGYPHGLAGDDIPAAARLMALADVYDALVTARVYKPAMGFEEAHAEILAGRGSHFDPDVVDAYSANAERFKEVATRFAETIAS